MNYLSPVAPVLIETLPYNPPVFKDTGLQKLGSSGTEAEYLKVRDQTNLTSAPSIGSTNKYIVADLTHTHLPPTDSVI